MYFILARQGLVEFKSLKLCVGREVQDRLVELAWLLGGSGITQLMRSYPEDYGAY